eukprot:XP_016663498.1 PREDICTED: uncharacterized protein LOC107884909 isoform X2 [Acyrthosiphon pisum]
MKKQLRCTENGAEVNTSRQEEIDKLRAEHEAMVLNLKFEHAMEIRNMHIYYESRIGELQIQHGMMVNDIYRDYDMFVDHLRSLNYNQGIRQEAALKSMRELKDQMRKDHFQEVQCMRLKYDNLVKEHKIEINGIVEENKLICAEYESIIRNMRDETKVLKENINISTNYYLTNNDAIIENLRNVYNSSSLELSSTYPKQNGTEVEGLQLVEEATIIAALQTTDGHEYSDAVTTTSTIADDDAVDMVKSQDTMLQTTVEDCQKLFYDTAQKLSLLHGYVFPKE